MLSNPILNMLNNPMLCVMISWAWPLLLWVYYWISSRTHKCARVAGFVFALRRLVRIPLGDVIGKEVDHILGWFVVVMHWMEHWICEKLERGWKNLSEGIAGVLGILKVSWRLGGEVVQMLSKGVQCLESKHMYYRHLGTSHITWWLPS